MATPPSHIGVDITREERYMYSNYIKTVISFGLGGRGREEKHGGKRRGVGGRESGKKDRKREAAGETKEREERGKRCSFNSTLKLTSDTRDA